MKQAVILLKEIEALQGVCNDLSQVLQKNKEVCNSFLNNILQKHSRFQAAEDGDQEEAQHPIDLVNIETKNKYGFTPLHLAATAGD